MTAVQGGILWWNRRGISEGRERAAVGQSGVYVGL